MSRSGPADDDRPRAGLANIFLYQPSGRAQRPPWLPGVVTRYIPAISCILIPFAVLFFYQITVDQVKYHIKTAAIPVLTVVVAHALIDWSASHLCEVYRDGLKPAGNAIANYWGLGSSGVLLGALLPSYFSWSRDVENWAATKSAANATEKDRETLIASEGLDFAPTASVSALLTVAIPALSGPILELLKSIPVLAGH